MLQLINTIVACDLAHAKWLNTLSFMENAGARKISACEDPLLVGLLQLKHAAEEHRHAYYLKKQIRKISAIHCPFYESKDLLAPNFTRHYLQALDISCCRYLKTHFGLAGSKLKFAAYLFVTYAIELRADSLYPQYQQALTASKHRVMVKSIIVEEEGHLEEMIHQLEGFDPEWEKHVKPILAIEEELFKAWIGAIKQEIDAY